MRFSGQKRSYDSIVSPGPSGFIPHARELNDSLYELYKPADIPTSMYVIFLHGLQSRDDRDPPHLSTWQSGDGSCLWPQTWLIERFPSAHVFSVSYTAHVKENVQGEFDIHNIGENLLSDILQENIGQAPYCPVILVGHCFGGFVIKELCNRAYDSFTRATDLENKKKLSKFLENIRGIYYYGTPHHGSPLMNTKGKHLGSNLLGYFKLLSKEGARLNEKFEQLRRLYPKWRIHGLGESRSTKSGLFQGVVGAPEASSRAGDSFNVVEADHIQICRPERKTNRTFYGLVEVLEIIAKDVKEEEARVQEEKARAAEKSRLHNLKHLPKQIIGIEVPIQEVKTKLVESRTLGLVGMGGCGKTTLAKAIFNNLGREFEYSSFVSEVKFISGRADDVKKEVWSQVYHYGEQMATNPKWSDLNGKSLLLVLDDVSSDRDLEVLFDVANDLSPKSRFLVTSRDRDLLKTLDVVYEVPFLNHGIAKELFMRHAFPEQSAPPSQLGSIADAIVAKCDGLPLSLEVIGKYLRAKDKKENLQERGRKAVWEQTLAAIAKADNVTGINERLWAKLKLSFIDLQELEQQVFLDVATFFCGKRFCTLEEAKTVWKAAYAPANEELLWRTLVDRSLVYDVEESESIRMHQQLFDLGRKIGSKHNKIRRVWDDEEAMELFESTTQREDEEIFSLRLPPRLKIARRALLCLKEVRYLEVDGNAKIYEDKEDKVEPLLTNLAFVQLCDVQQHFTKVLFDSSILTRLIILKLDMYHGEDLPESFGDLSALKILELRDCYELHSLPKSFGHLSALSDLQFKLCHELQTLPESFGNLSALSTLRFSGCTKLQTLLESFGNLSALSTLRFSGCTKLQTLPESFGNLSALSTLRFNGCTKLQTLPESFGNLSALSTLRFSGCTKLQTLPESFGNLSALSTLWFSGCTKLQTLPESFGLLTKLESLIISNSLRLDILPDTIAKLIALRHLSILAVALTTVPDSIRTLPSLQVLKLGCLPLVKEFPPWLGGAEAGLRKLSVKIFHFQDGNFALAAQRELEDACKEDGFLQTEWGTAEDILTNLHSLAVEKVSSSNFVRRCDECGMYPLEWPRYESITTLYCVLCPNCFQQSGSNNVTDYTCVDRPVQPYVTCDFCKMCPLKGPRYKPTKSNVNFCHDCFQESGGNASDYICFEPQVLTAGDGSTEFMDAWLALIIEADDEDLETRPQQQVFVLRERGVLKRLAGDLLGALEDLNHSLEIGLSEAFSDFDFRKYHGYACWKHRAYVKFLLGDLDGARRDAGEALSIRSENIPHLDYARECFSLGAFIVKFLEFEM